MVKLSEDWDNPKPRENEKIELEKLLENIKAGKEHFIPTSKERLERSLSQFYDMDIENISFVDRWYIYGRIRNYCISNIISTESEEQMKYIRRLMIVYDRFDELIKKDPATKKLYDTLRKD